MKQIKLGNKEIYALVDDADFDLLSKYKWYAKTSNNGYSRAYKESRVNGKVKRVYMSRFIMEAPRNLCVDHINLNPLDNRRSNLRLATVQENNRNRDSKNRHGYKGVAYNKVAKVLKKRWVAELRLGLGKRERLGTFLTVEEAARAYDEAAIRHFGEFARLNFPALKH